MLNEEENPPGRNHRKGQTSPLCLPAIRACSALQQDTSKLCAQIKTKIIEAIFAFKKIKTECLVLAVNFTKSDTEGWRIPTHCPA